MNGTFSSCPKRFYQLYVLHVIYRMKSLPVVYALLPKKKTRTVYAELLMALKDTCSSVKSFSIDRSKVKVCGVKSKILVWQQNIEKTKNSGVQYE